jgi:hypothetical protein
MLLMRGKKTSTPTILLLLVVTLFGRKKTLPVEEAKPNPNEKIFPTPEAIRKSISTPEAAKARDQLRLANFEREILGDVMTKIYEAEAKGELKESEKNTLVQHYKSDLKRVDSEIDNHRKIVNLYELESAKEDLLKSFNEKMMEIDLKISQIQPNTTLASSLARETKTAEPEQERPAPKTETPEPVQAKEKTVRERPKNKAEERLDAIREEVLKAMERLEQIETEG